MGSDCPLSSPPAPQSSGEHHLYQYGALRAPRFTVAINTGRTPDSARANMSSKKRSRTGGPSVSKKLKPAEGTKSINTKKSRSDNDDNVANKPHPKVLEAEKPRKKRLLSVQETCDLIAELSESILEDPDKAFASTDPSLFGAVALSGRPGEDNDDDNDENDNKPRRGPSKMQQLLMLAGRQDTASEQYTAQLAITSLLLIFKDILPAYRIRVPTAQEMAVKVSKETKRVWDQERGLLHNYQQYLKLLEKTWARQQQQQHQQGDDRAASSAVSLTAMLSLAELLKAAFHFNFRSNLITAVVRQMNHKSQHAVREACCRAVETVFAKDTQGEVALEVARQVAKLCRDCRFRGVHPDVLRTFLHLPLRVHVDEAQAAKLATAANAKKRRRDKETASIEAELKEGKATVDKIVLARCQSDTLQTVTLTYFRVLKSENPAHVEALLPPALEGLAKFAHLINIDTVMDLLGVLKELLRKVETLALGAALNCILTAFQTLQGPGKEMKIDPKEYIVPLYSQLPRLTTEAHSRQHTDLVMQCLNIALIQRREYSTVRVAAFFKQILTTALHTPPETAVPLLALARQLIQRYTSVEQMLENEQDVITSGEYTPVVEDPEHAKPFATSAWELAMLQFHVHSTVAHQAASAAQAAMLQLPAEGPERLRSRLLCDKEEVFISFQRSKKKHPLQAKASTSSDSKKVRNQIRFVTPRTRECSIKAN